MHIKVELTGDEPAILLAALYSRITHRKRLGLRTSDEEAIAKRVRESILLGLFEQEA